MREGRNEPSNITFIVDATAKLLSMSTSDLSSQIRKVIFFIIRSIYNIIL